MVHKRYDDKSRLIADMDEYKLTDGAEVIVYREDQWHEDVAVILRGQEGAFEELKPLIAFTALHLCEMDFMAQKYSGLYGGDGKFDEHFEAAYIRLVPPEEIRLTYFGAVENTEFDVVFWYGGDGLLLKSFGMEKNIPADWDV